MTRGCGRREHRKGGLRDKGVSPFLTGVFPFLAFVVSQTGYALAAAAPLMNAVRDLFPGPMSFMHYFFTLSSGCPPGCQKL